MTIIHLLKHGVPQGTHSENVIFGLMVVLTSKPPIEAAKSIIWHLYLIIKTIKQKCMVFGANNTVLYIALCHTSLLFQIAWLVLVIPNYGTLCSVL